MAVDRHSVVLGREPLVGVIVGRDGQVDTATSIVHHGVRIGL
jgi:hypothetical protein